MSLKLRIHSRTCCECGKKDKLGDLIKPEKEFFFTCICCHNNSLKKRRVKRKKKEKRLLSKVSHGMGRVCEMLAVETDNPELEAEFIRYSEQFNAFGKIFKSSQKEVIRDESGIKF